MSIQYLLVTFSEQRGVLADGAMVGVTNHILMLPADEYQISLDGSGYAPASQDVPLDGTSVVKPRVITFTANTTAQAAPTASIASPSVASRKTRSKTPRARKTTPKKTPPATPATRAKGKKNA